MVGNSSQKEFQVGMTEKNQFCELSGVMKAYFTTSLGSPEISHESPIFTTNN